MPEVKFCVWKENSKWHEAALKNFTSGDTKQILKQNNLGRKQFNTDIKWYNTDVYFWYLRILWWTKMKKNIFYKQCNKDIKLYNNDVFIVTNPLVTKMAHFARVTH